MNIAPDTWSADLESTRAALDIAARKIAKVEQERDEARRIARHARQLKRDEEDHRMEVEAQVVRLEAQSEVRRLQIEYMKKRIQAVERLADTAERMFATIPGTGMALEIRRALDVSPD